jgi:hypothetical protein
VLFKHSSEFGDVIFYPGQTGLRVRVLVCDAGRNLVTRVVVLVYPVALVGMTIGDGRHIGEQGRVTKEDIHPLENG